MLWLIHARRHMEKSHRPRLQMTALCERHPKRFHQVGLYIRNTELVAESCETSTKYTCDQIQDNLSILEEGPRKGASRRSRKRHHEAL